MQIDEVPEEAATAAIPRINLSIVTISQIENLEPGAFVDVKGVIESCEDVVSITRRDGSDAKKRSLTLRDDSNASIEVTLWGDKAQSPGQELFERVRAGEHPIAVVKGALSATVLHCHFGIKCIMPPPQRWCCGCLDADPSFVRKRGSRLLQGRSLPCSRLLQGR